MRSPMGRNATKHLALFVGCTLFSVSAAHAQKATPQSEVMIRGFADGIRNTGNYAQAGGSCPPA